MKIKNFRFKKIGIYIKNLTFFIFKSINQDRYEKNVNKVHKIMRNINQSNISSKIKSINNVFDKFQSDPFLLKVVALQEISGARNPEDGFDKMKNYNFLLERWIKKNNLSHIKKEFISASLVTGAFGNYWQLFYYLMYKVNIETEKSNLLLKDNQKITNSALFNYFTSYLNIIQNDSLYYKLEFISRIFKTPLEATLPFKDQLYPCFAQINFTRQLMTNKKDKKFDYFKINKVDYDKGKKILKKMGIPDNAWYVTLHIREGVGDKLRNSNPFTYVKAIKEIIQRGGYVFRVGDKSMTPLPKINRMIDYPFSEHKSEFFDIFLASTCRFCIGTSSGYWGVPTFFRKPVLLTNYLPVLDYYSLDEKSLFLPKYLMDKNTKKLISIEKVFSFPHGKLSTNIQLDQNNVDVVNNNEDEIFQSTAEMLDMIENKRHNKEFTIMNEKFKKHLDALNTTKYKFPLKAMANFSTSFIKKSNQQSYI